MVRPASRLAQAALLLCFLAPLLVLMYLGIFSRYIADDYCTASRALSQGVIGSTVWWYNNWAGTYTNWLLKAIVAVIGPVSASLLPLLVLVLWFIALTWALHGIGRLAGFSRSFYGAVLLASLIIYATFDGTPSLIQSLYWIGAVIPYTLPLIPLTLSIAFFARTLRYAGETYPPYGALIIVALVTVVSGGLYQVYAVFQIAVLGLVGLGLIFRALDHFKRRTLPVFTVALVSALVALAVVAVAPGNTVRQALFPHQFSLPELAVQAVIVSAGYIVLAIGVFSPLPLLITVIVSGLLAYQLKPANLQLSPKLLRKLMALSAGVALLLIMACLLPALYGLGTAPSSRAYVMPQFVLVSTAAFWGILMGCGLKRLPRRLPLALRFVGIAGITLLLVVGPLASTWQALEQVHGFRMYAAEWDARDQDIREAALQGQRQVEVRTLTVDLGAMARLDVIGANPQDWVNQCAADYYGLESLTARSALQMAVKDTGS